jgi:hypothetical protein
MIRAVSQSVVHHYGYLPLYREGSIVTFIYVRLFVRLGLRNKVPREQFCFANVRLLRQALFAQ